jgi:hypothetical protein
MPPVSLNFTDSGRAVSTILNPASVSSASSSNSPQRRFDHPKCVANPPKSAFAFLHTSATPFSKAPRSWGEAAQNLILNLQ